MAVPPALTRAACWHTRTQLWITLPAFAGHCVIAHDHRIANHMANSEHFAYPRLGGGLSAVWLLNVVASPSRVSRVHWCTLQHDKYQCAIETSDELKTTRDIIQAARRSPIASTQGLLWEKTIIQSTPSARLLFDPIGRSCCAAATF